MADKVADQVGTMVAKIGWLLDAQRKSAAGPGSPPVEQWRVLELLHERGGRSMSDLAQLAVLELPTLSKMIDRMVGDALVYRAPDTADRRRVLIFLSDRGRGCLEVLLPAIRAQNRALAERLGKTGIAALRKLSDELGPRRVEPREGNREAGEDPPGRAQV